jgi:hypothetical protein
MSNTLCKSLQLVFFFWRRGRGFANRNRMYLLNVLAAFDHTNWRSIQETKEKQRRVRKW